MTTTPDHVELIREVFHYAQRFRGKRFVIQIASSVVEGPRFPALASDLALLHNAGISLVLVPAAGGRIDRVLEQFGVESRRVDGVRITSDEAMPLIKMAGFDVANMVMTQLTGLHIEALIGNWVRARAMGVRDGVDYQNAGLVAGVQTRSLTQVLQEGHVPILPCIGWSATGKPYNISSIELAVALAEALQADKLFFLADRVLYQADELTLPTDATSVNEGRVSRLSAKSARELLRLNPSLTGTPAGEMLAMAHRAGLAGVERVHILDGHVDGAILKEIFSTLGQGTMVYTDEFEAIRPMQLEDIPEVLRIMEPNMAKGILVQRSEADLQRQFEQYHVFDTDGTVRGCCALHPYGDQAELAGLVVESGYGHLGIGAKLVQHAINLGKERGYTALFLLTTQTADFFEAFGFVRGEASDLPPAKRDLLKPGRNSRVYFLRL